MFGDGGGGGGFSPGRGGKGSVGGGEVGNIGACRDTEQDTLKTRQNEQKSVNPHM